MTARRIARQAGELPANVRTEIRDMLVGAITTASFARTLLNIAPNCGQLPFTIKHPLVPNCIPLASPFPAFQLSFSRLQNPVPRLDAHLITGLT